ncbi:carcinoembryonic antigen-related cell adhesion molecule 2-like isoform X5 [Simochromis diagramma]|uniref:carcinoembryonic antigen-related cell adhesion molecule 2-like isoform X5 n=1 Tax=Simochromis diagramma TaxID=43689 RepID=UPI001A7E8301|nr:carcinoembryonic antigen-related cell adhesion molecule 2-like isoform X5 [Simochromis diagramma]
MLRSVGLRILLLSVGLVLSDKDSFKKVGDKVVLSPGSVSDPITSITWKHGPDIAVEWYGGDIVPYRDFRGRCEVSTSTGALTLSNVTVKDSGIYTAEINNRVMSPTKITVLSAVPKPTVSKSCNPEMTICTLTCEASITDDTKPVTYSWVTGDRQTAQSPSNQLTIAKNDTGSVEKSISCQLENPVSSERSDNIIISFASGDSLHWIIPVVVVVAVIAAAALLGAGIVLFLWKKNKKAHLEIKTQDKAKTPEETLPLVDKNINGAGLSVQGTSSSSVVSALNSPNNEIKTQDKAKTPEETLPLVDKNINGAGLSVQGTSSSSVVSALNSPNNVVTAPEIHNENELESAVYENEADFTETSKTTSVVKDELSQGQTTAASTDTSSEPDNLQAPQQGPDRTTGDQS